MKNKFLIFLTLFISITSFAGGGNEIGNGGAVVSCPEMPIIFYDHYEMVHKKETTLDLSDVGQLNNYVEIAQTFARRVEQFDPEFSQRLEQNIQNFSRESSLIRDMPLASTQDHGLIYVPRSCHFEQLIVQFRHPYYEDARYLVKYDLWQSMSELEKAVAVLHEVLYREADLSRVHTSEPVREFVVLVLSGELKELKPYQYKGLKSALGF